MSSASASCSPSSLPTELWQLGAAQTAALVASRRISATEATQAALARLGQVNPGINAVVDHRPDDALRRAADIDAALARREDVGPLAGVPVTIKVNVDQKGFATTNGVRLQKDLIAEHDSPVVHSLLAAGAVIIGRTNTPAFSYRWFTGNQLHGVTRNPRNPALTPGGSSGGAAAAVAAGIGAIGHGTDIAGSIRYPAYACGVHGLRPSFGRVAAWNASSPERTIGGQLTAVSGPIARHVHDLRLALAAMARPDACDPWSVPAPLVGPAVPRLASLCVRPDGLATTAPVEAALRDAAARLRDAGWQVDEVEALPPLKAAADDQTLLWVGDGYEAQLRTAEREGDPAALVVLRGQAEVAARMDSAALSAILVRRATLTRQWQRFLHERYPLVLLPVSAELPFPVDLDLQGPEGYARVWAAQMTQIALPFMGLPGLTVSTGMAESEHGPAPVGVQLVAARFREDLCLEAAEAIEARGVPPSPVTPRG
ncbi:amidase family protein [uncultured Pseudacidovorax sp.]|uniref:amidase family protein n=1 Tax=uncultured Pseudacidovorax sp. TaxID=679313 RepID=UPI0025D3307D|nr:amidase family protein [uncultured Pseudacidovorax sp.]